MNINIDPKLGTGIGAIIYGGIGAFVQIVCKIKVFDYSLFYIVGLILETIIFLYLDRRFKKD